MRRQRREKKQVPVQEVIPVVVKPATAAKLRIDVTALENDVAGKTTEINKLQADVVSQNDRMDVLEAGITP